MSITAGLVACLLLSGLVSSASVAVVARDPAGSLLVRARHVKDVEPRLSRAGPGLWADRWVQASRGVTSRSSNGPELRALVQGADQHLPRNLSGWNETWHQMMEKERGSAGFGQSFPAGLQIVLGVFDLAADLDVRNGARHTWMRQPGVCSIQCRINSGSCPDSEACVVFVAFVHGVARPKNATKRWAPRFTSTAPPTLVGADELQFDFTENMNKGKTFEWFSYASQAFPWATHVGKMDTDTFPHFHVMLPMVAQYDLQRYPRQYLGQTIDTHGCNHSVSEIIAGNDTAAFHYCVQGFLYLLSRELAEDVTGNAAVRESIWEPFQARDGRHEDICMGHAVSDYVRRTHHHVQTLSGQPFLFGGAYHGTSAFRSEAPLSSQRLKFKKRR